MSATPSRFYKYRTTNEHTESIFVKRQLYFAAPRDFNDPFDCGFHILCSGARNEQVLEAGAFQTLIEKHPDWPLERALDAAKQVGAAMVSDSYLPATSRVFLNKLAAETNRKAGILSLSEKNDDILMWSHYADCHRGICIEFCAYGQPNLFEAAKPVVYSEEYPRLDLLDVVTDEKLRAAVPWMLTKSKRWEYEKEWRVLDFDAGPGLRSFPPKCLTGVILGCRIPEGERKRVLRWASEMPHEVSVYSARESSTHFRLTIEKLDL